MMPYHGLTAVSFQRLIQGCLLDLLQSFQTPRVSQNGLFPAHSHAARIPNSLPGVEGKDSVRLVGCLILVEGRTEGEGEGVGEKEILK